MPRTPAGAVLWECYRLSRRPLLMRMGGASLIGGILLVVFNSGPAGAVFALLVLIVVGISAQGWSWSVDNRRGFTLVLGFTRPISTWVLVVVPMLFIGVTTGLTYLVPAVALRLTFDIPFPLLPVAAALATINVSTRASQWWTADGLTRMAGRLAITGALGVWFLIEQTNDGFMAPQRWSEISSASSGAYARMLVVFIVAVGVTVLGVGRQRRGDDVLGIRGIRGAGEARTERAGKSHTPARRLSWRCPTGSSLRAQLWFEARAIGFPVVMTGVGWGVAIAFLVAIIAVADAAPDVQDSLVGVALGAVIVPPAWAARRVLGLQREQGNAHLGSFDGTRPMASERMIAVRVGVATVALLAAWASIVVGAWASLRVASMGGPLIAAVAAMLGRMSTGELITAVVVVPIQIAGALACWAAINAWIVMRSDRMTAGALALAALAVPLAYAVYRGWTGTGTIAAAGFALGAALVVGSAYVLRLGLGDRIIRPRGAVAVVAVGFAAAALHVALFYTLDVLPGGMSVLSIAVGMIWLLVPVTGVVFAPWSFSRLRHR